MKTFLTIWVKPLKTFEYLDNQDYDDIDTNLNILFYLGTLGIIIPNLVNDSKAIGDFRLAYLIFGALFGGFFGALLLKFAFAFIVKIIGKILQGKASIQQVRIVLAYMMIPGLINLVIALILILIAILIKDIEIIGYQNPITQFVLWIFSIRTLLFGLAKYNRFSYGFALLNVFLSFGIMQGIVFGLQNLVQ